MKKKIICLFLTLALVSSSSVETALAYEAPAPDPSAVQAASDEYSDGSSAAAGNEDEDTSEIDVTVKETSVDQGNALPSDTADNSLPDISEDSSDSAAMADTNSNAVPEDTSQDSSESVQLSAPQLVSAENTLSGVRIVWNRVEGADGYRIYRKAASSKWEILGSCAPAASADKTAEYVDETAVSGTTCTYSVQAYRGSYEDACANENSEEFWSGYDTAGLSVYRLSTPEFTSAENTSDGIQLKWNSVPGASKYQLYRKTSSGSWDLLTDSASTSYTDKNGLKSGAVYLYSVQASKDSQKSCFNEEGISVRKFANPVLSKAENAADGIKVTWKAAEGADRYCVYRKTASSSWVRLGEVSSTSYTDSQNLSTGTKYIYTVRALEGSNRSWYDSKGVSAVWVQTPALISAENTSAGVTVKWNAVKGATSYRFYRKTEGGSWDVVANTTSASYTDKSSLTSGTEYIYTVRAYKGSDRSYYDSDGITVTKLSNPSLTGAENTSEGIKITWKAMAGVDGYRVYRKTSGTSWERLVDATTATSYTDKSSLSSGTSYTYTVRAFKGEEWSWYNSGTSVTKLDNPVLSKAENNSGGIKVTWKSVKGASSYRVYRKTSGTSWVHIGTTSSASYTDKSSLSSGTSYIYTVRAVKGDDRSWYDSKGVTELKLSNPTLSSAENTSDGIKITWKSVKGAEGYRVYRKTSGGSWTRLTDSTTALSYTDKSSLTSGTNYIYTVRAYKGSDWGWYNSGITVAKLSSPSLSKAENNSGGIKITWKSVKGASGYRVYRKTSGGSWTRLVNSTSGTSYTDKSSLTSGTKYYYTVRALKGSSLSWYNTTGVSETKLSIPSLSGAQKVSGGVKVSWSSVKGASGYYVYRKSSGGSWSRIASTKSTSYTDKTSNINYIYTVRAYKGSDLSWYNSSGVKVNTNKMLSKAQSFSSNTKWLILVDTTANKVGIYYGSKGNWVEKKYWSCTSGAAATPTVKGSFTVQSKGLAFGSGYTCWYYTQFYGNYLFHSILYNPGSQTSVQDGRLGINASHGCVRLSLTNAKWIYDNIPRGTKVYIY